MGGKIAANSKFFKRITRTTLMVLLKAVELIVNRPLK